MKKYQGNITPEYDTIFVFGSNPEGRHGAGSAAVAVKLFGAEYGNGEGLQGNAYALPTTELRWSVKDEYWDDAPDEDKRYSMSPAKITENIKRMYACAREHPDKKFKVAYRNQPNERTLCGYTGERLMSLFKSAAGEEGYPENIYFSEEWVNSGLL